MKVKSIFLSLAFLLTSSAALHAQNVADLVISEVLAEPDSTCIVDDFGKRTGWIEILNTSQGIVNMGGCYLTDDKNDLKKSLIPKTDNRVQIGPRQVALFFATGNGNQGAFYSSFKIRRGSTIYLVSNDGRTIVDSIVVPENLPVGMSVSKLAEDNKQMEFVTVPEPMTPSPRVLNGNQNVESNAQRMARQDPHGWILSATSVAVVFIALAILWFLFWLLFERVANAKAKKEKAMKEAAQQPVAAATSPADAETAAAIALALDMDQSGDTYAAIALGLHLYFSESAHDLESNVLTLKPMDHHEWSSKSSVLTQSPR